jgi:Tol biopolymer transport system component
MLRALLSVVGTVALAAVVAASGGAATKGARVAVIGAAAWSPSRPEIAFGASIGGQEGIAVARTDGSGFHFLTPSPDPDPRFATSSHPAWSPDGNRIAFESASASDGTSFVRIVNRDGTGLQTIAVGMAPSWSPDGRRLVFEGFDPTASPAGVEVADVKTGTLRSLVPWATSAPVWQPHGTLVAFSAGIRGSSRRAVYVVGADGTARRKIAAGDVPAWSSDGRYLAYSSAGRVDMIRADGSGRRLVPGVPSGDHLAWAPVGGHRLVSVLRRAIRNAGRGWWVVDLASGRVRRLGDVNNVFGPSWSRDGKTVAIVTPSRRLFVARTDGSGGNFLDFD